MRKIIIAIDGYSSCGKSTLAKSLAQQLHYRYVDSGAMYRAITLYCIQHNLIHHPLFDEAKVVDALKNIHLDFHFNPAVDSSELYLNGANVEQEIRQMNVANHVSAISAIKQVRELTVQLQRNVGKGKGIVMDGRDISTHVFPDAEVKLFMTASIAIRTERRWKELTDKGTTISYEEVRNNLLHRDHEDTHRQHNPLIQAPDAVVLDNSHLTIHQQLAFALDLVKSRI
jgi:cytidylate kinase